MTQGGGGRPTKTQNTFLTKSAIPQPVLCPPYTQLASAVFTLLRLRRPLGNSQDWEPIEFFPLHGLQKQVPLSLMIARAALSARRQE